MVISNWQQGSVRLDHLFALELYLISLVCSTCLPPGKFTNCGKCLVQLHLSQVTILHYLQNM